MDVVKPKPRRRVASYEEPPMRKINARFTAEQHAHLLVLGEGNASLGVRRALEYMAELEATLPLEEWEELIKSYRAKRTPQRPKKALSANTAGRPSATTETVKKSQEMYSQGRTIKEITVALKIHQSTVYKYVDVRKKKPRPTHS